MWTRLAAVTCLTLTAGFLPTAAPAGTLTIQVTSVTVSFVPHDVGPKGASKGDTITYRDKLLNVVARFGKKKGARVGTDTGKTTFLGPHAAAYLGKTTLPGGTLTLKGRLTALADGGITIPIAGGTGKFANAHGTLTVSPGRDHVLNTYRFALASLPVA